MKSLPLPATTACVLLAGWIGLLFLGGDVRAQNAPASYQAAVWDKAISLPPGAYRAGKPVVLDGDFEVRTQSGTLIEAVNFQGHKKQHWHIEGTQMRKVRIAEDLLASTHGIDSVFEDCDFVKDTNWWYNWWTTRWIFDNCIFTKRFMREDLFVRDYAEHCNRCTFYGVKLPTIGFKENPASYLQKADVSFEKCRFVDCDVPEQFLAATVDCVFEGCRFTTKRFVWPKETTAISVRAFIGGTGSAPSSYVNGPLSVQFLAAPKDLEAGTTLVHTQMGGRVTLTKLKLTGQFTALASVPRKASEIVDSFAAVAAVLGTPTPAPTTATVLTAPTPTPGAIVAADVKSLEEILRSLPSGIDPLPGGQLSIPGMEAANFWLEKTYKGRTVALRATLESTRANTDDGYAYEAAAREQDLLFHGKHIPARALGMFRTADAGKLATVQRGADFMARGVVRKVEFTNGDRGLAFAVTVGEAKVQ